MLVWVNDFHLLAGQIAFCSHCNSLRLHALPSGTSAEVPTCRHLMCWAVQAELHDSAASSEVLHVMRELHQTITRACGCTSENVATTDKCQGCVCCKAVWLVGGLQKDADYLIERYRGLDKKATVLLNHMPLAVQYARCMKVCFASASVAQKSAGRALPSVLHAAFSEAVDKISLLVMGWCAWPHLSQRHMHMPLACAYRILMRRPPLALWPFSRRSTAPGRAHSSISLA